MAAGRNPYDALDPIPAARRSTANEPSAGRAFARGMIRRCPRCGSGHLFRRWLTIRDRCPRCGLRLEREEGGFLGAMTINFGMTTLVWLALLIVWLVVDLPAVHLAALTVTSILVVALFPLAFFPLSKTIWAAVDYLVYRSSPDYRTRDAADRSGGNGGTY